MILKKLNEKGIEVTGHYFTNKKNLEPKEINSQINLMIELHKLLIQCNFSGLTRIESKIGRELELYNVQMKRIKKYYDELIISWNKNDVDMLLIAEGKRMLNQASSAIEYIYNNNYFNIIERSMNRKEICIGRVDSGNLRKNNNKIEIGLIKSFSYNLIEEDLYRYIKKIQRKNANIDENELINLYVNGCHLPYNSINYLKGLCSYPKDFFKTWERYKKLNSNKTYDEYALEFEKILKYEKRTVLYKS